MNVGKNIFVLIFVVLLFALCGKTDDKINSTIKSREKYFQFTVSKTDGKKVKLSIETSSFKPKHFRGAQYSLAYSTNCC